jgi:glycosyltransferase involved in cell wall biosynthesis
MTYTLLITTKNKPEFIKDILSKFKTNYEVEILVFDIDPQDDKINNLCKQHNAIRVLVEQKGMAWCFNHALEISKYEYIVYCQDDVEIFPYCFDMLYDEYVKQDKFFLLSPNITEKNICNLENGTSIQEINYKEEYLGRLFCSFIISKTNYHKVGGFDINFYPVYFEDMDFFHRAKLLGLKVGSVSNIKVHHLAGQTTRVNGGYEGYLARSEIYYLNKWGGQPRQEIYTIPWNGKEPIPW